MKNEISLAIPKPCHENWDAMTPEKQGRFCGVCSKTVIDFTMMTDGQILEILKNTTGSTCGKFSNSQLDRPLVKPLEPKWYMVGTWKYILSGFLLFGGSNIKAQVKKGVKIECTKALKGKIVTMPGIVNEKENVRPNTATETVVEPDAIMGEMEIQIPPDTTHKKKQQVLPPPPPPPTIETNFRRMGLVVYYKKDGKEIKNGEQNTPAKKQLHLKDKDGIAVANGTVIIALHDKTIATLVSDESGYVNVDASLMHLPFTAIISHISYQSKIYYNKVNDIKNTPDEIVLEKNISKQDDANIVGTYSSRKGEILGYVTVIKSEEVGSKIEKTSKEATKKVEIIEPNVAKVFPNPAESGQQITVFIKSENEDMVGIQILTIEGKHLSISKHKVVMGNNNIQLLLPSTISGQQLNLSIFNSKGKLISTQQIIIQN